MQGYLTPNANDLHPASSEVKPYAHSSKEFTLTQLDREKVIELREWLQVYFAKDFQYESTLFLSLNKVREFIMNEQSAIKKQNRYENNMNTNQVNNMPREYDLVVKVEKVHKSETPSEANEVMKIMTGGKQPEMRIKIDDEGR